MNNLNKPLKEVKASLIVSWYRCPIDSKSFRQLMQPDDLQGWLQAGGHLIIFFVTGSISLYFAFIEMWFSFFISLFFHCTSACFFKGVAAHELGHGTVFKTKKLNKLFLIVYSLLSWHNHHEYNISHTYHHRYTLHPEGDREVVLPLEVLIGNPFNLLQIFTFNFTGGPVTSGFIPIVKGTIQTAFGGNGASVISEEWSKAIYTAHKEERRKAVIWARIMLVFHSMLIIFSIYLSFWPLVLVFSTQQFTANWLKYFVGLPMHCGLRSDVSDFRKCVRSITLDPISEFLYWRMNWHLEHHMFAGIPCYNLKKIHRLVAHDMPKVRTLWGAWMEMIEIKRRQDIDPGYEFDTPVPYNKLKENQKIKNLTQSIGDLAPRPLK
mgnify:FL=1